MVFREKKNKEVHVLSWFRVIFPFKLPAFWHIFDISFDRKSMKFVDVLIFMTEYKMTFSVFFYKAMKFLRIKPLKWTCEPILEQEKRKRSHVRKPVGWKSNPIIFTEKLRTLLDVFSLQKTCLQISFIIVQIPSTFSRIWTHHRVWIINTHNSRATHIFYTWFIHKFSHIYPLQIF